MNSTSFSPPTRIRPQLVQTVLRRAPRQDRKQDRSERHAKHAERELVDALAEVGRGGGSWFQRIGERAGSQEITADSVRAD